MSQRDEVVRKSLVALRFMPARELEHLCDQRSDDLVSLLDELQLRFPAHRQAIGRIWADTFHVAYVDIETTRIDPKIASRLGYDYAMREGIVALYDFDGVVTVATSRLENRFLEEQTRASIGTDISVVFAFPSQIVDAIEMAYQTHDSLTTLLSQSGIRELTEGGGVLTTEQMRQLAGNEYIIKFVRGLILLALSERASDIHIEPGKSEVRIRFRIDGALQDRFLLDAAVLGPITSRLKIMADLDISEHRLPQDGRIGLALRENTLDLRFSSIPSVVGEKIVLRVLGRNKSRAIPDLEQLSLSASVFRDLQSVSQMPNGIFLVTGPTGSGKTTTLYALLKKLNAPDVNILTVEDPVEYRLEGVTQVQVNTSIGLEFGMALRAFLRQDPDIILVGEIRDAESGRIAAQAALTGHLVLSTLHTNSALESVTRLIDIGVEPFLVAPAIIAVMAQRLVRQICTSCRVSYPAPKEVLETLFTNCDGEEILFWKGEGCDRCGHTGYYGRIAVHELFRINLEVRDLIARGATSGDIQAAARRAGFRTMRYDGLKKVLRGLTTIEQLKAISYLEEGAD
jgi:type IV pilus assembly protein PilB